MDFSVMRQWAIEAGFAEAVLCDANNFDIQRMQVSAQPFLKERKQLRFAPREDDQRISSIAVLLWPYKQAPVCNGRSLFVDSYYSASNAAYHAAMQLEKRLTESGVFAKANVPYPAKEAAMRAGFGVIGQNSLLIHPRYGSRVVIILMATDIECHGEKVNHHKETCMQCGRCAAACPSGAIDERGMSHPEICLRNFMMEGITVPEHLRSAMGNRLLGCDICQRVCPMQPEAFGEGERWLLNDFAVTDKAAFSASIDRLAGQVGRNTARPQRVRAQAALLCGNLGNRADLPVLYQWAESDFEAVREHAKWAIKQIELKDSIPGSTDDAGLDQST